jgi:hypothetical protein
MISAEAEWRSNTTYQLKLYWNNPEIQHLDNGPEDILSPNCREIYFLDLALDGSFSATFCHSHEGEEEGKACAWSVKYEVQVQQNLQTGANIS